MKYKFGFLGCGNMGSALAGALCKKLCPHLIAVCDKDIEKAKAVSLNLGCAQVELKDATLKSEYIFIAVKPQGLSALIDEIKPYLEERSTTPVFVTMCAAVSIEKLLSYLGKPYPVIRIMPNTPVLVGAGMTLYTANSLVKKEELSVFADALEYSGALSYIEEKDFDSESIISGCGPAYVYMFIDALAKAAIELGVPKDRATEYAKRTAFGASQLALLSDKDLETLKMNVCSPGGTTIEGVRSLEGDGLEKSVANAAKASYKRTLELRGQ